MRGPAVVLFLWVAVACQPAESPGGSCKPIPPGAHGCLDGDVLRPVGCTLPAGPVGPYSPGSNCSCVARVATGLIEWDCKKWLM
jgi:hypothetical protein